MERAKAWILWFTNWVINTFVWELAMFIITLYILTGDTWRICYINKDHDWLVEGFSVFALTICVVDILFRTLASDGYKASFLFWMDVLSLYSICWDISVLVIAKKHSIWYITSDQIYLTVGESVRILCLLRLARLARLVNVDCRQTLQRKWKRSKKSIVPLPLPTSDPNDPNKTSSKGEERSRVGNEFIEVTVRKVIVVIVVVCLIFPLLEPSRIVFPNDVYKFQTSGLGHLHEMAGVYYSNSSRPISAAEEKIMKESVQVREQGTT